MRLLLITETVPYPLDSGGRIKTFHTLRALAQEHEVHCHAFVRDAAQREATLPALTAVCASVTLHLVPRSQAREAVYLARSLATGVPFSVTRHYEQSVMDTVSRQCREAGIEAVYCDHLSMFEDCRRMDLPIVHDAHNVEYRIVQRHARSLHAFDPRRPLLAREWRRLRAYEATMYARSRLVFAVSDVDAAEIRALGESAVPVVAVPIAVDARALSPVSRLADEPRVLFVGGLDWPPNAEAVDFCIREIWPLVRAARPDAELVVVGRGEMGARARWSGTPGVQFTGRVADVQPWFERSRATVVPLRAGSGMRVKILDAFARGVPVVATPAVIEGIDARPGTHALVESSPGALAAAILRVLSERSLAESLAAAARRLVLERYDYLVVQRMLLDAIRAAL